jgi:hypothetical protein
VQQHGDKEFVMTAPDYLEIERNARALQSEEVCRVCALVAHLVASLWRQIGRILPGAASRSGA